MAIVKLISVGSSTGVILPDELLDKWKVRAGGYVHLIETERGIELTPCNAELQHQLSIAESVMQQDRETLKKLAN